MSTRRPFGRVASDLEIVPTGYCSGAVSDGYALTVGESLTSGHNYTMLSHRRGT